MDSTFGCRNTYPLNRDLSGGWRYPAFQQPGPGIRIWSVNVQLLILNLVKDEEIKRVVEGGEGLGLEIFPFSATIFSHKIM